MYSLNSYKDDKVSKLTDALYMAIYNRVNNINKLQEELLRIASDERSLDVYNLQRKAQHIYFMRDELKSEIEKLMEHFKRDATELEKCLTLEDFNINLLCNFKDDYVKKSFIQYKTTTAIRQILLNKGLITQKEFHL